MKKGHAKIIAALLSGVMISALATGTAGAQQAPGETAQTGDEGHLTEIVVTAQKRAQNLQDVPIAIQAFTGDQLKKAGVSQLTDVTRITPNLNVVVQNALSQHIIIRGVGTNEFFGNAPSSVGLYIDEVTVNSSYGSTLGLFDIERVEVLRGPQNSLFGRNTTGGAVNYVSKLPKPGDPVGGYAIATYGRHNQAELEGAVTLPLGSTLSARIAGIYHYRDGIWNNLDNGDSSYGDKDHFSLRGTLVWEPGPDTRLTFSAHHARARDEAQPQRVVGALNNNPPLRMNDLAAFTSDISFKKDYPYVNIEGFDRDSTNWHDVTTGGSQRADLNVDGGYLKVEQDFGAISLTSISAYDKTHAWYEEDNTANGNRLGGVNHDVLIIDMDQKYEQFTQELRLASTDNAAAFKWIAGLYYLKENSLLAQDIRFGANGFAGAHPSAAGITPPSLFDVIPNPYPNTVSFSVAKLRDESFSAYGQGDYDFTDKWTLTVGLRYTHDNKGNPSYYAGAFDKTGIDPATYYDLTLIRQLAAGLPACPSIAGGALPFSHCANDNTSRENLKSDELGGKITLQYHASDDVMIYGGYSRGFKSGKFDVEFLHTDATPFPQRPLKVETLDSFELGLKSTLADRTLLFNAAVFYNIWKDQQVFNVGVHGPEFFNLPKSRIIGLEAEMTWIPVERLTISGGIGLLDTKITDVTGIDFDLGEGDFQKGHELPLSPPFTANAVITKTIPIGDNELSLRVDGRYQSKSKVKFSPQIPIDEYESRFETNARITYSFGMDQRFQFSIFGNNLTSEKYCVEKQDLRGVSGSFYCVPNDGEIQYGAQLRAEF